jgi:energy-coupling factor transport system substrate-specific component
VQTTITETGTPLTRRTTYRWRVVDIVVASVLGVASGIIFWAWGLAWTPLSGILAFTPGLEGLGAELVFAIFLYANWRLWGALIAGAGAGVAVGLLDTSFTSYAALEFGYKLVYFFSAVVSGILLAGLLSWLAVRGLAKTGALSRFAAGRESTAAV